jgi:hypothetical protein
METARNAAKIQALITREDTQMQLCLHGASSQIVLVLWMNDDDDTSKQRISSPRARAPPEVRAAPEYHFKSSHRTSDIHDAAASHLSLTKSGSNLIINSPKEISHNSCDTIAGNKDFIRAKE